MSANLDFDFEDLTIVGHASAKNMHAAPAAKVHCSIKARDKEGNEKVPAQFTTAFVKLNNAALQLGLRDKPVFGFIAPNQDAYLCEYRRDLFPDLAEDRVKKINPNGRLASSVIASTLQKHFKFTAEHGAKAFTLSIGAPVETVKGWVLYKLELIDSVEDDDLEEDDDNDSEAEEGNSDTF